jgi:hypothetical protein
VHGGQECEHVAQAGHRVDAVAAAALHDGVEDGCALARLGGSNEQPVLLADGGGADGVFHKVVVDLDAAIGEEAFQRGPLVEDSGVDLPPDRVVIFNALLALRARQAAVMQSGNLNTNTIVALSAKAKEQVDTAKLPEGGCDPEKNARYLIRWDIRGQAAQFLNEDIDDVWDTEQLRLLAEGSQWDQVITQATQFIVKTRGRTRLIDKGANLISKALNKFEG